MATMDTTSNKENDTKIAKKEEESTTKIIEVTTVINGDTKEEEATSTSNSNNENENKNDEKELLSQARKLMDENKYDLASNLLSSALQIIQTKNTQKVISIDSVKYYMAYGESLLRFVQSSNDLFAAPVREKQQQLIAEQEQEIESDANNNNNGDVDTSEDREIAWETLEYARTIIEDYLKNSDNDNEKYLKMLAQTHSFLGELLIEDENNENALKEFEKAFVIHNKCGNHTIECRQIAFDRFMACLAAQFCGDNECALKHCDIALAQISKRIMILLHGFDVECKENEYINLVQVAQTFMGKMSGAQKEDMNGKELVDLVASMQDLICKLDEVKENIKHKKENKGDCAKEAVSSDPLTALINGLTSKFGIDEQQLAELDEIENKNKNKNKNDEDGGVTTIGFGNNNNDVDNVNELGSFGKNKSENKRKRSLSDAGIDFDDGMDGKKVKLNCGDAAKVENNEEK